MPIGSLTRKGLVFAVAAAAALTVGAGSALACACCAENGTWYERAAPLQKFERDELGRLRFAPAAHDVPAPEGRNGNYTVTGSLRGTTWRIQLSGLPALTFRAPARATTFATDLRDGEEIGAGGPFLYKELRLSGSSAGPGTHYRLVLQGRGNNCLNAGDFTHWRLDITGGKRELEIYGDFRKISR